MFFAILAVTVVLTMSSAPDKKAKAGNIICPTCGAEGYGSHPTTSATCTEPAYEILYYEYKLKAACTFSAEVRAAYSTKKLEFSYSEKNYNKYIVVGK